MSIETVLEKLEEEDRGIVLAAIEAEKNRGIEASRSKGKDVNKFMTEANKLKDAMRVLGIDPANGIDEQIAEFKTRLDKAGNATEGGSAELKELQRQFKAMSQKLESTEKEKEDARRKYTNSKLSEALSKEFGDTIYGVDLAIKDLLTSGKVKLRDDDSIAFVNGEEEIDVAAGVESFRKARPDLVKNNQRVGGASAPQGAKQSKTITAQQYETMTVRQRAEFFGAGGEVK